VACKLKKKEAFGTSLVNRSWVLDGGRSFVASTPMPVRAEDNDKDIRAEITALQAQVASLQSTVSALQTQLAAVQSNHALLLGPFVNVDPNPEVGVIGPNIIFSGANIHIVGGYAAHTPFVASDELEKHWP
jgi:hypothetical protein